MKYGVIIRNVTDLRAHPIFRSERKSQLLLNETVTISSRQKGYLKVTLPDGYSGWVDEKAVYPIAKTAYKELQTAATHIVTGITARLVSDQGGYPIPPFLFYGTTLAVKRRIGQRGTISMPGGKQYQIAMSKITRAKEMKAFRGDAGYILKEARRFLGVPYVWGGMTPFGFDCSGLVQTVFRMAGVALPRDSKDQMRCGNPVDHADIRPGDLLFFPGHVAIALGRGRIIHASLGEGGVAVNSLVPNTPGFRKDLYESFRTARRALP
ncbi:MAG: C40 family peptidase [candidate division Zixibacteria bacterium]|nr:C40 family peptidase [candidate division Zixibacteria bacterium]